MTLRNSTNISELRASAPAQDCERRGRPGRPGARRSSGQRAICRSPILLAQVVTPGTSRQRSAACRDAVAIAVELEGAPSLIAPMLRGLHEWSRRGRCTEPASYPSVHGSSGKCRWRDERRSGDRARYQQWLPVALVIGRPVVFSLAANDHVSRSSPRQHRADCRQRCMVVADWAHCCDLVPPG